MAGASGSWRWGSKPCRYWVEGGGCRARIKAMRRDVPAVPVQGTARVAEAESWAGRGVEGEVTPSGRVLIRGAMDLIYVLLESIWLL